jgi:REP element-mobilizing transposase RayT
MKHLVHVAIRAHNGQLLFKTWVEARELWKRLSRIPGVRVLVLMPDHIHVLIDPAHLPALGAALSGFARWRNRCRGESGQVWSRRTRPSHISDAMHARRSKRYLHLNACRKGLVKDPLAWAFSTHRDACGLTLDPLCRPVADVAGFHDYVSSDKTTHTNGTPLPAARLLDRDLCKRAAPQQVLAAVSALTRCTPSLLRSRRPQRAVLIGALRSLTDASAEQIAVLAGVHPTTVYRTPTAHDRVIQLVERVLGDPRFLVLKDGDIRASNAPGWDSYRRHR